MKRRRRQSGRVPGLSLLALASSSPACVAYKKHMEKMEEEIIKAFTLPERYVIMGKIKRIRWRIAYE